MDEDFRGRVEYAMKGGRLAAANRPGLEFLSIGRCGVRPWSPIVGGDRTQIEETVTIHERSTLAGKLVGPHRLSPDSLEKGHLR